MLSQIPGGTDGLEQLVCDGMTLRGSAIQTDDGSHRFVAQVTVYACAYGVALAQKAYDIQGMLALGGMAVASITQRSHF
jgi:hypothetical protein